MTEHPPEQFLTRTAAAKLIGVSPRTLDRWTAAGKVAAGRTPGGAPRYRRSDLEALISPQAATPPRPALL